MYIFMLYPSIYLIYIYIYICLCVYICMYNYPCWSSVNLSFVWVLNAKTTCNRA